MGILFFAISVCVSLSGMLNYEQTHNNMNKEATLLKKPVPDFVQRFHEELSEKNGWIAAIESESGKYVVEKTLLEAARKARDTFPGKVFYFIRIGFPYVHRQTGGLKKFK